MHELVLAVIEEICQRHAILLLEDFICLTRLARHPVADDGVHRMIRAAAVHTDPAQLFGLGPIGKFAVGTGMLNHVTHFVRVGRIPAKVMVAGMDDENIALADFDAFFDHFAGVYIVIAANIAQVNDCGLMHQKIHFQGGNILARGVEVDLPIKMGAKVVGMRQQLSVRSIGRQAFEILQL